MTKWSLKRCKIDTVQMSKELDISPILANVIANRNISTRFDAINYINPKFKNLYNIDDMKDVKKCMDIIINSVSNNEKIVIYGDYDVDGVTSTTILYKTLKAYGADVDYYIPDRAKEGYGLNNDTVIKLHEMGFNLIFTCDNGIAAIEEVKLIKSLNMKVLILDHHEPPFEEDEDGKHDILPEADSIIDAKQSDCTYKFKQLCAGGLSYKFANAFFKYVGVKYEYELELFIFAAIATVCDMVDLLDENRTIVKIALKYLNDFDKITNKGLKALLKYRNLNDTIINEYTIGFIIGPCINACGRLESATLAVKLFTTDDDNEAEEIAQKLSMLNQTRKDFTNQATKNIIQQIEESNILKDKVLVVYAPNIHESIIGIVAGKIKEKYYKPTIVITNGEDFAKASARSIDSYNIFEELSKCKDLFVKFGGHAMAAGFSIEKQNINILRERINQYCRLTENDMVENVRIDRSLSFKEVNLNLAEELEVIKPIGKANEAAIFATKNILFDKVRLVGKNKDIIQFALIDDKENIAFKGFSFSLYDKFKSFIESKFSKAECNEILLGNQNNINLLIDIVYSISINEYNGHKSVQLDIIDFRETN